MSEDSTEFDIALATIAAPEPPDPYNVETRIAEETLARYHQYLLDNFDSAEEIGRFVLRASHKDGLIEISDFARKMGVSKRRAYEIVALGSPY